MKTIRFQQHAIDPTFLKFGPYPTQSQFFPRHSFLCTPSASKHSCVGPVIRPWPPGLVPKMGRFYPHEASTARFIWDAVSCGYGWVYQIQQGLKHFDPSDPAIGISLARFRRKAIRKVAHMRANLLLSVLRNSGDGLCLSSIFHLIEPSDKAVISQILGGSAAQHIGPAAIASRLGSRVDRLLHTRLFSDPKFSTGVFGGNPIKVGSKNKLPDYFALDASGGIHVFECKGTGDIFHQQRAYDGLDQVWNAKYNSIVASLNTVVTYTDRQSGRDFSPRKIYTTVFFPRAMPEKETTTPAVAMSNKSGAFLAGYEYLSFIVLVDSLADLVRPFHSGSSLDIALKELRISVSIPKDLQALLRDGWDQLFASDRDPIRRQGVDSSPAQPQNPRSAFDLDKLNNHRFISAFGKKVLAFEAYQKGVEDRTAAGVLRFVDFESIDDLDVDEWDRGD